MQLDAHLVLDDRIVIEISGSVDTMVCFADPSSYNYRASISVLSPDAAVRLSNALLVAAANRRREIAEKAADEKRQLEFGGCDDA